MRIHSLVPIFATLLAWAVPAPAVATSHEDRFALSLSAGLLGTGLDGSYAVNDRFSIRANANYSSYELADELVLASTIAGIPYDYDLRLLTVGLLADYEVLASERPGNSVTLTGGVYYNWNRFKLTSTPISDVTIGGTLYSPADVGTLTDELDFDSNFAPYIGMGVETNFFSDLPISVFTRAGLLFQGSVNASLSASGSGVNPADLAAEEQELEDSLGFIEVLPVFWVGATVRF
jgi:hypothetical protein